MPSRGALLLWLTLGLFLFNICINDLYVILHSMLMKFTVDIKFWGVVNISEGRVIIQKDGERLGVWAGYNTMRLYLEKVI